MKTSESKGKMINLRKRNK